MTTYRTAQLEKDIKAIRKHLKEHAVEWLESGLQGYVYKSEVIYEGFELGYVLYKGTEIIKMYADTAHQFLVAMCRNIGLDISYTLHLSDDLCDKVNKEIKEFGCIRSFEPVIEECGCIRDSYQGLEKCRFILDSE